MAAKRTRIEPEPISITPPQKINLFEGIDLNALSAALSPPSPSDPQFTPETEASDGLLQADSIVPSTVVPESSVSEEPIAPTTANAISRPPSSTRSSKPPFPRLSTPKRKRQSSVRQPSKAVKSSAPKIDLFEVDNTFLILTEMQLKTLSYLIKVSESSLNFTNSNLISNAVGGTPLGAKDTLRRLRKRGIIRTRKDTLDGGIHGFWIEIDTDLIQKIRDLYSI